jgi:TPR repeat protein/transglutaminase-like putative cysteine protease
LTGAAEKLASQTVVKFSRGTPLPKWAQALAELPGTSRLDPVVMRLAETQAWVGNTPAIILNRAIKVNDRAALSQIGQFSIPFYPTFQKLALHRVVILRNEQSLDRTATVNVRLLEREEKIEEGVYGGAVTAQLLLQDVRVGDTLWITYSLEGTNPVFGKLWSTDFGWDLDQPIELRRLTVIHSKQRPLYWRQVGDFRTTPVTPIIDAIGEMQRLRFEERALAPIEYESSVPTDYLPARFLQFSEHPNWQSVAGWAENLFPKAADSFALKSVVLQFAPLGTKAEQAAAALHWVQNEIRYFSVSIGENSHRPQSPDVVLRRRYGDCKDKSYLLVSILARLGIQAKPVLVAAQAPMYPAKTIPTPGSFDHVIVRIELDRLTYYVDPTQLGQKGGLANLPPSFPGAEVLLVDKATVGLTKIPEDSSLAPSFEHIDNFSIAAFDADVVLEAREIYRGPLASWARQRYPSMSASELRKDALSLYEKQYAGVTLVGEPTFRDVAEEGHFEWVARYSLPKPVTHKDGKYTINFKTEVIDGSLGIPPKLVRNYPFKLPKGKFAGRYRLNINWPATLRAYEAPYAKMIDTPFFAVREEFVLLGNQVTYLMDYRVKRDQISAPDLPNLQIEAKRLDEFISANFSVKEQLVVKPESLDLSYRDVAALRSTLSIVDFAKTYAKSNKKSEIKVAEACDVVVVIPDMIDFLRPESTAEIADLERTMAQEKREPGVKLCMARWLAAKGEFAASVPLFEAEEPLKEDDPLRVTLAWAKFYAGDKNGAIDVMQKFKETRVKAGTYTADNAANLYALLQRMEAPVPPDLQNLASELVDGPWPRPVLAYQQGIISAEQLLKIAEANSADARSLALNDAWFYIGQRRLSAKDYLGAETAFKWFRPYGVFGSSQYRQAKAELKLLDSADKDYVEGQKAYQKKDLNAAREKWLAGANRGYGKSQFALGSLYHAGEGVPRDYATALSWFRKASEKRDALAQNMLGVMYVNGDGVEKDEKVALEWFRLSAEGGNAIAANNLGLYYLRGTPSVKQDLEAARRNFRLGAALGNPSAQAQLGRLYLDGTGVKQNFVVAFWWSTQAAQHGDGFAMVSLGDMFAKGLGQKLDLETAKSWYLKASLVGFEMGKKRLSELGK